MAPLTSIVLDSSSQLFASFTLDICCTCIVWLLSLFLNNSQFEVSFECKLSLQNRRFRYRLSIRPILVYHASCHGPLSQHCISSKHVHIIPFLLVPFSAPALEFSANLELVATARQILAERWLCRGRLALPRFQSTNIKQVDILDRVFIGGVSLISHNSHIHWVHATLVCSGR